MLWLAAVGRQVITRINSLRPSEACMRRYINDHWFRQWLATCTAPSHYLNQCWNIVNWTLGNKLKWSLNQNLYIFLQENAFENAVRKTAAILSRPQCVNVDQEMWPDIATIYNTMFNVLFMPLFSSIWNIELGLKELTPDFLPTTM